MLPPHINNIWRDPIPSDACEYAYGCTKEVVAVIAQYATDDGVTLDAIAERRPLCVKHLAVYVGYFHEYGHRYEVHPVSRDDLCAIAEERGSREHHATVTHLHAHPSDLPHYYVPEL